MKTSTFSFIPLTMSLLFFAACQKDSIDVREGSNLTQSNSTSVPANVESSSVASADPRPLALHWKLPKDWKQLPASGMRAATLVPPNIGGQAEVSIIALPGEVGDELSNVNRWRGQIALSPIGQAELSKSRSQISSKAGQVIVHEFTGTGQMRAMMVIGMIKTGGGMWFIKLLGDEKTVLNAKPAFLTLLKSLSSDNNIVTPPPLPDTMPDMAQSAPVMTQVSRTSNSHSEISWTTPNGWKELPASGMRTATFQIPNDPKTEITVVKLPGDVGGELANVNRWRGQISLPPVTESELSATRSTATSPAGSIIVHDFSTPNSPKTHVTAAMIQVNGTMWFFKMSGAEENVLAAKPSFMSLISSLRKNAAQ